FHAGARKVRKGRKRRTQMKMNHNYIVATLVMTSAVRNQFHRGFADKNLRVKLLAPAERCDVAILINCRIVFWRVTGMKLFSKGGPDIGVRPFIEKELSKRRCLRLALIIHPKIRLRDDSTEPSSVTAESISVDSPSC